MEQKKFTPQGAETFRMPGTEVAKSTGEVGEQTLPKDGIVFSEAEKLKIQGEALRAARTKGTTRVTRNLRS